MYDHFTPPQNPYAELEKDEGSTTEEDENSSSNHALKDGTQSTTIANKDDSMLVDVKEEKDDGIFGDVDFSMGVSGMPLPKSEYLDQDGYLEQTSSLPNEASSSNFESDACYSEENWKLLLETQINIMQDNNKILLDDILKFKKFFITLNFFQHLSSFSCTDQIGEANLFLSSLDSEQIQNYSLTELNDLYAKVFETNEALKEKRQKIIEHIQMWQEKRGIYPLPPSFFGRQTYTPAPPSPADYSKWNVVSATVSASHPNGFWHSQNNFSGVQQNGAPDIESNIFPEL
jgi:hypothetical protein